MVEIFDSIKQVNANFKPYKKWAADQDAIEAKRQILHKTIETPQDRLELANNYGKVIVDAVNTMDRYSENKAEDVETTTQTFTQIAAQVAIFGSLPLYLLFVSKFPQLHSKYSNALQKLVGSFSKSKNADIVAQSLETTCFMMASTLAAIVPGTLIANNLQKGASRIARYQAREQELKDPRNFVVYTPEQVLEAQEIAKTLDDVKEEKEKHGPIATMKKNIASIKSLLKDKEAYDKWKTQSKIDETEMKKLHNVAITPEQLEKAKAEQEIIFNTIKKIDIASQEYSENFEVASNVISGLVIGSSYLLKVITDKSIKLLDKFKVPVNKYVKAIGPWGLFVGAVFSYMLYATKLQKEAAKVGRFKAKQDLLSDPHNFIHYTKEQMDSVKPEKVDTTNKNFLKNAFSELTFFYTAIKDYKEYKNYKKTTELEEIKLKNALKQVKINDSQQQEAVSIQDKAFRMFEKMDENSQRYAEDIEAAGELFQSTIGMLAPYLIGGTTFKMLSKLNLPVKANAPISIIAGFASVLGFEVLSTKLQKKASKIGLMNAIKDMEDPRNFVDYTKDQIQQAQSFEGETKHSANKLQSSQPKVKQPEIPSMQTLQIQPVVPSLQISEMSEWMKKIKSS